MKIKTSAIVYGIRYIRRFGLRTLIIRIIEKRILSIRVFIWKRKLLWNS